MASACMPQVFDIETGFDSTLLNLNPDGWVEGVTTEKSWRMLYGMDVGVERQLIIAGAPTELPGPEQNPGAGLLTVSAQDAFCRSRMWLIWRRRLARARALRGCALARAGGRLPAAQEGQQGDQRACEPAQLQPAADRVQRLDRAPV